MKRTLLAILAAAATLLVASCSSFDIPGTRWAGKAKGTISMGGLSATVGMCDTLQFTGEASGKLIQKSYTEAMGTTVEGEATTTDFSYKFDGSEGTITMNSKSHPFTYNRRDKSLTVEVVVKGEEGYDEFVQSFGSNSITFKMY